MKLNNNGGRAKALLWLAAGAVLGAAAMQALHAQQAGIQRVLLMRNDVPEATAPMELVLGTAEIPAGEHAGKHRHTGVEVGYVLSGTAVMEVEGQPPRTVRAGDTYFVAAGKAHDAIAEGNGSTKVLAFYLVEKGKPLATAVE